MIRTSTMYWYECDLAGAENPSSECYRLSDAEESMTDATTEARKDGWALTGRHLCPKCKELGK